ncbi:ribonuclease III domain-containing protein [Xylaria telfairii]|nr:ribonuclease III domain-containing protein [Xylaria telfairii]
MLKTAILCSARRALLTNGRTGEPPLLISRSLGSSRRTNQNIPSSRAQLTQLQSDTKDTTDRASKLVTAQQILNYEFQNKDLLYEALQTPGLNTASSNENTLVEGNKRLAGVGDAVITLVIKLDCYMMNRPIGEISGLLQRVVSNYQFASKCVDTGLSVCIHTNPSQRGDISPRTLADTLEAVIGAVYLDGGIDKARLAMQSLINYKI